MALEKIRNKAFLIILQTGRRSDSFLKESFAEMKELAESAGLRIVGSIQARVPHPSPSHFVRAGKLEEIFQGAKSSGADVLIFNLELSPGQARNIERDTKIHTIDRTGLILDIFGRRAQSREGKLQVELARLNYVLPRLGGLGGVMSRLGGGIGTRGPGEPELEHDRRKIRRRIQLVKEELKKVHQHRALIRSGRKKKRFVSVAIVGYTNAGKSTLLNALTGADAYVADKMFATLDPKTRLQNVNGRQDLLFIDTVGFLKDLPHGLVESFHATLEEVAEADILIHVLDVSNPKAYEFETATGQVLKEIGAEGKPTLLALNKADLLNEAMTALVLKEWPQGVLISAKEKLGINSLIARLMDEVNKIKPYEPAHPADSF